MIEILSTDVTNTLSSASKQTEPSEIRSPPSCQDPITFLEKFKPPDSVQNNNNIQQHSESLGENTSAPTTTTANASNEPTLHSIHDKFIQLNNSLPEEVSSSTECRRDPVLDKMVSANEDAFGELSDGEFEEVSWFFAPDGEEMTVSTKDIHAVSVSPGAGDFSRPIIATCVPPPPESHAHSDDEDFADCFEDVQETVKPLTAQADKLKDIQWLNNALASLAVSSTASRSNTNPANRMPSSMYSRNMANMVDPLSTGDDGSGKLHSDNVCTPDILLPAPLLPNPDTPLTNSFTVELSCVKDIVDSITRSDRLTSHLLGKAIGYMIGDGGLHNSLLDNIHVTRCVGPLSQSSDVYRGFIVHCTNDVNKILAKQTDFKTLVNKLVVQIK